MSDRWPFRSTGTSLMTSKSAHCAQAPLTNSPSPSLSYSVARQQACSRPPIIIIDFVLASNVFRITHTVEFHVRNNIADGLLAHGGDWNSEKFINTHTQRVCTKWVQSTRYPSESYQTNEFEIFDTMIQCIHYVWRLDCVVLVVSYHRSTCNWKFSDLRQTYCRRLTANAICLLCHCCCCCCCCESK